MKHMQESNKWDNWKWVNQWEWIHVAMNQLHNYHRPHKLCDTVHSNRNPCSKTKNSKRKSLLFSFITVNLRVNIIYIRGVLSWGQRQSKENFFLWYLRSKVKGIFDSFFWFFTRKNALNFSKFIVWYQMLFTSKIP